MSIDTLIRTAPTPPAEFAWAWALERPASDTLNVRVLPALDAAAARPPRADELILWFGLPGTAGWPDLLGRLGDDEQVRAARFHFAADRWAFAAAHAGLRALLGRMLACPPRRLRFATGAHGKPHLDRNRHDTDVAFNISHTRGCVVIAVARRAVGIDVEQRRTLPELMDLARIAFGPEAQDALAALAGPQARTLLFYRYWTLGEAFIKATGEGIGQGLSSFAFTEHGAPALTRIGAAWGPMERWRFHCDP